MLHGNVWCVIKKFKCQPVEKIIVGKEKIKYRSGNIFRDSLRGNYIISFISILDAGKLGRLSERVLQTYINAKPFVRNHLYHFFTGCDPKGQIESVSCI